MKYLYILTCLAMLSLASCKKDLEKTNINPNNPSKVEPDFLLTSSIFNSLSLIGGDMNRVVFFNYTQYFSGFQGEFQRYTYNDASNNTYWSNFYIRCLQPVNQIQQNYNNDPAYRNRVLIARIWKDYLFSDAVAIWGGIPTNKALTGDPSIPYTKEQDVYTFLLSDLKNTADSINLSGDKYGATADKIYGGDLLKWKKFANTLRLRLAIRISNDAPNGDPALAQKVIKEVAADEQNTITAQAETAAATWGTTSDTWNYLYNYVTYNYTANKATIPVLCESLVYYTVPYGDPRITIYGQPAKQGPQIGKYFGQNISYGGGSEYVTGITNPHTGLKQDDYSYIGERFLKMDAEYVFISYAESCFLKAEAALKGWWNTTSAQTYYYQGIDGSFNRYGLTAAQATTYENTPGIKWGTASDTTGRQAQFQDWMRISTSYVPTGDNFKQIIMQHWLATPKPGR
jgi:hypothetical protein